MILAVSLALIALLVETSGRRDSDRPLRVQTAVSSRVPVINHAIPPVRSDAPTTSPTTSTPTTQSPPSASLADKTPGLGAGETGDALAPSNTTTTTTSRPVTTTTTTTTAVPAALAADRSQTEGYFDPPLHTSGAFEVNGSGPTEISVLWSVPVYLTMTVTCPSGSQTVGGTTAMEASLPEASGCQATVSEPSSESTSLTYTFNTGPANG